MMAKWKSFYHRIKDKMGRKSTQEALKQKIEERNRNFETNWNNLKEEEN